MLTDVAKFILEFLKLAPRYLVAVSVVCALLLFSPPDLQQTLGTKELVHNNRQWLGVALVASLGVWLVVICASVGEWVRGQWQKDRRQKSIVKRLQDLTEREKQILRYYYSQNARGNKLKVENGDVQALIRAGIIFRSANVGSIIEGFAHNITDFAWDYIHKNPQVLKGSTNVYYTDQSDGHFR